MAIALTAMPSAQPLQPFGFKRSGEWVKAFLFTPLPQRLPPTSPALLSLFHQLVQPVVFMGRRDRCGSVG